MNWLITGGCGFLGTNLIRALMAVEVNHLANPRKEAEEHYYNPSHTGLLELGLEPNYLTDEVLEGLFKEVRNHQGRIFKGRIFRGSKWA